MSFSYLFSKTTYNWNFCSLKEELFSLLVVTIWLESIRVLNILGHSLEIFCEKKDFQWVVNICGNLQATFLIYNFFGKNSIYLTMLKYLCVFINMCKLLYICIHTHNIHYGLNILSFYLNEKMCIVILRRKYA